MIYGYARVSTKKQIDGNSLENQRNLLKSFGAEKIFEDTFSGFSKDRPQLNKLLSILENGDTLITTKLDRIARSIIHGRQIIQELKERGVQVHIIEFGGVLDDTPTGRLMLNMFFSIAEFERDLIIERTQIGKEIARTKNGYREGRPPKFTKTQLDYAMQLLEHNTFKQVSEMMRISERTLYRESAKRKAYNANKCFKNDD